MSGFLLALAFWAWSAFIALGAGLLGAALKCEDGCIASAEPRWTQPWTLRDPYVFPEVFFVALAGLAVATLFAVLVRRRRVLAGAAALGVSVLLLAYPFFGGLTSDGRRVFWFGPLIGAAALALLLAERREPAGRHV